jgi:hypothetical protein
MHSMCPLRLPYLTSSHLAALSSAASGGANWHTFGVYFPFMKQFIRVATVALALVLVATSLTLAQSAEDVFGKVEAAMRSGDATSLSANFNPTVELSIDNKGQDYSKNQAQFVIKEFLQANPVVSFAFSHRGNSGTNYYAVGNYVTARGTFDVNVLVKKFGAVYQVHQLRIEREN